MEELGVVYGKFCYHYTTAKNFKLIGDSGIAEPSTNTKTDARMGLGVYLTSKQPQCKNSTLTFNNSSSTKLLNSTTNESSHIFASSKRIS